MDPRRIDGQKLEFHPHRVAQWIDGRDDWEKAKDIYPLYVEVSPVGACNHRCTFCAVDYLGYKADSLDEITLSQTLREMAALGVKSVMFAGEGEPLLHKQINKLVLSAPMDVAITTNGTLLDRLEVVSTCKWIKVSINAGTEATYEKVHKAKRGDWDKVWRNLKAAVARKGSCTIGAQMVLLPENEAEIAEFQARCMDAGLDYGVIKPYSQHRFSINKLDWKPVSFPKSQGRIVSREEAAATERPAYDKCSATPFFWAYIKSNGDVYSCSAYLGDDRFLLGNIESSTFREIWGGERRRRNWEYVREHLDISECRVNCRMDKANRFLAGFSTMEHINFV